MFASGYLLEHFPLIVKKAQAKLVSPSSALRERRKIKLP
jgi:hypothetical protein